MAALRALASSLSREPSFHATFESNCGKCNSRSCAAIRSRSCSRFILAAPSRFDRPLQPLDIPPTHATIPARLGAQGPAKDGNKGSTGLVAGANFDGADSDENFNRFLAESDLA